MAKKAHAVPAKKLEKVSVAVIATDTGYYNNRVYKEGQKFLYEDHIKGRKLPLWMKYQDPKLAKTTKVSSSDEEQIEASDDANDLIG
jgi:hypothetical protein